MDNQLLSEIISILTDESESLYSALLKTRVLIFDLENPLIEEWLKSELEGYRDDAELPFYRIIQTTLVGTITNGPNLYANYQLPTGHIEDINLRNKIKSHRIQKSVSQLESYKGHDPTEELKIMIPIEVHGLISSGITGGYRVIDAHKTFPVNAYVNVLANVRSKLLEFILEIRRTVGVDKDLNSAKEEVNQIFQTTIIGNNNIIQSGYRNVQNVSITVVQGDIESLKNFLKENYVAEEDLNELEEAVQKDGTISVKNHFGERVKKWVSQMFIKALEGSWIVGTSATGQLLAEAINKYYGL